MHLFESLIEPAAALTVIPEAAARHCYGGLPGLPDGTDWPAYGGTPMTLLARLDCADLAAVLPETWTLPTSGTLLFFYEDDFTAGASAAPDSVEHDDGCRVLHVPAGLPPRPAPAGVQVIPPLPLAANRVGSVPPYEAPALRDAFTTDPVGAMNARDLAEDTAGRPPRHQVLGWQRDAFLHLPGLRPLLQLEAEPGTAWGEVVNVSFWLPEADLAAGRLTGARRYLETA
ncbi:DUF1963 domain-containing protein [Dactylosporangium sp. NPDC049525]|uniref:DUF1963 domain-containing protein n=1 Tax=Dactylosporangium sp. NPDC049525 TaxID=3154730 RepID=UPI00344AF1DE